MDDAASAVLESVERDRTGGDNKVNTSVEICPAPCLLFCFVRTGQRASRADQSGELEQHLKISYHALSMLDWKQDVEISCRRGSVGTEDSHKMDVIYPKYFGKRVSR